MAELLSDEEFDDSELGENEIGDDDEFSPNGEILTEDELKTEKMVCALSPCSEYDTLLQEIIENGTINEEDDSRESLSKHATTMMNLAFGTDDYKRMLSEVYEGKAMNSGYCRRVMKDKNAYGFKCLDCMGEDSSVFVCQECFTRADHINHIVLKIKSTGVCDCGDFDNLTQAKANCSKHRGKIEDDRRKASRR